MKEIGGYFGLEPSGSGSSHYHPNALSLTSGRAALKAILKTKNPSTVFVPYYICDSALIPFRELKIPVEFYGIGLDFHPLKIPELRASEMFLMVNYFGVLNSYSEALSKILKSCLIIDNTQAFFCRGVGSSWSFNSARKFFGVADGAYLYGGGEIKAPEKQNDMVLDDFLFLRTSGKVSEGYEKFLEAEAKVTTQFLSVSQKSDQRLRSVDYESVSRVRTENFRSLDNQLRKWNQISFDLNSISSPMAYPFLPLKQLDRTRLISRKIYVARYWMDILKRPKPNFSTLNEQTLSENLFALPIDQRYDQFDMERIAREIKEQLREE